MLKAAVVIAGLNGLDPVKCSKDVVIVPDQELEKVKKVCILLIYRKFWVK
jgi:hypothetical protein